MVVLVQDASVISHGPVGCSACLHKYAFAYRVNSPHRGISEPTQRKIYSTNLDESDTVFGGSQTLEESIREVYARDHPNAIFVLTSCATGIVGDDVEGVCVKVEKEIGIPVAPVFCEGFRSKVWTTGFDAGYHGILRKLVQPPEQRRDDLVNVINFWGKDIFSEWFGRLGVKPNYITPYSTVESLRRSSEAAASVLICSTLGSYMGAALEQVFGVPQVKAAPPYGIKQTDRWFRELGKVIGKETEVEAFLAEQKERYIPQIEEIRKVLSGKTAYITAGAAHGHSLISVLADLGMKPMGAAIFHHDPVYDDDDERSDALVLAVKDHGDVPNINICNKQEFELVNSLKRIKPDILLARHGGMTLWGTKLGIPSILIGDEHFSMGYEGLVKYGNLMIDTLDRDEFAKNLSKHAVNPYTEWWLEQDTCHFLRDRP
jgi:nitrogenase molybdenum-iron protein alpha chain